MEPTKLGWLTAVECQSYCQWAKAANGLAVTRSRRHRKYHLPYKTSLCKQNHNYWHTWKHNVNNYKVPESSIDKDLSAALNSFIFIKCLECLTLLVQCKSIWPIKIDWWRAGVVICLKRGADCLHMVQLMPLHPKTPSSLASFKSRLVLPFWYRLTQVVLEKRSLNGCSSSSFIKWHFSKMISLTLKTNQLKKC